MSIKGLVEKRKIEKSFGKYVDKKVLAEYLSSKTDGTIPEEETIDLLLLKVGYADLADLN